MVHRAFIILLMFELCSVVTGLPFPDSQPLPSPTLTTAPIISPSLISRPIPSPHSNETITTSALTATKSTYSTLMTVPPSHAMASSSPSSASKFQSQSAWSPSDVGTVVFGCIGSVLGILTLWLTFWLGRQRFRFIINEEFHKELQPENLP